MTLDESGEYNIIESTKRVIKREEVKVRTNLKNARKRKGFTVEEMADMLGITKYSYYKIEEGIRTPKLTTCQKIAKTLDSTIEYLFLDEPETSTASTILSEFSVSL